MFSTRSYCLISPCRDEENFIRRTLDSVATQSITPAHWVIVDDGSKDQTPNILAEYQRKLPYLKIVRLEDRGFRSVGPGVVEAFYAGYKNCHAGQYDYICKLDLDLELPPRYFEILLQRMEENPRLGACSGKAYYPFKERLIKEVGGDEIVAGMAKFYRTECFQQIGGFVREVMWDGIDCHRCRMLGWIACSWDEPELRFIHMRPMGSSQKGIWAGRKRHGFGQYFMGTMPAYMAVSVFYRMVRPPLIIGGLAMAWGYFESWLTAKPRYEDSEFRRFLRKYQWACLRYGKVEATRRLHEAQRNVWKPTSGTSATAHLP